ncbi:double zinc ribbon and ankyrin repeat-containing protein 1 [Brachyistius frenatus]|uniref:double zinc ribbon and ankyrin repeat-containing protein 1 n=1 Tax=Brachyistius frenatus TaxID=100188 RepID=UPI0037E8D9A6
MAAGSVSAPLIIPIIQLQTHRAKNHINTSTPVSIHSDSAGVLIFFSLDGSKPAAVQRGSAGSSRKYNEPFLLPAGRVSVRAVAITSDGRQSSVVTKVFTVDVVDSDRTEDDLQFPSAGTSCFAERPTEQRMMGNNPPHSGPRFLDARLGSGSGAQTGSSRCSNSAGSGEPQQRSSTQASRLQRDTDFLRCVQCLSLRPSDPFARFCAQCGGVVPPLPGQRLPPTEGGQMLLCVFCNSLVPVNTQTCLICEASIDQQLQPQASRTLQDRVLCVCCGSRNPAHISSCVTCERHLQPVQCVRSSAPSGPAADSRMLSCSRCKRTNHSDARYCDWCGSKPGHAAGCVTCWRCGASGHPYAFYCASCGVFLEAPPTSYSDITHRAGGAATSTASAPTSHDATWQATPSSDSAPSVKLAPPTVDQHTQTVGLFYPSATELQKKELQRAEELSRQQVGGAHRPLLTAISPGRGFWRKQLDHVCAHLRSYAQNNAPFRTLLGEPRLGRIVSAVIQEDQYEVSVTVSFVSAGLEHKQVGPEEDVNGPPGGGREPAGGERGTAGGGRGPAGRTLSSVTERHEDRSNRQSGEVKPPRPDPSPRPPVRDGQLLKELGPGRGQISAVQQLLDQGADPSCCGSDGRHALSVAVVNGHHDIVPVLVQRGAGVDQQSGPKKNTALHESAALGSAGLQCAEVLLRCKASVRRRNGSGQTAYDVAVTSGCSSMAALLAAQTGLDLLGKLGRPKLSLDVF